MKKLRNRHILWGLIALFLIFIMRSLLGVFIMLIVSIDYYFCHPKDKDNKDEKQNNVLEINDTSKIDEIRLVAELARKQLDESARIKKETDIRQFAGRNDVTKEEVLEYMFDKDTFVGFIVQQLHLERIQEVCNISDDDKNWITHELWGKTKVNPDSEGQAKRNYIDKKQADLERKIIKDEIEMWREMYYDLECNPIELSNESKRELACKIKEIYQREDRDIKHYMYEDWLKMKGYV